MKQKIWLVCVAVCLGCQPVAAQDVETGWLDRTAGYREKTIGARMVNIDVLPQDGTQRITLAIPKSAVASTDRVHEVIVVGHKPPEGENRLDVRYEWASDYDNDYYGLILFLGDEAEFPIRLYFKGEEPDNSLAP